MGIDVNECRRLFQSHFGFAAQVIARAPGRVNIIGEHTDYNGGFVLPMAIERQTAILAKGREDGVLNAFAANLNRSVKAGLDKLERNPHEPWIDYVVGVAYELNKLGKPIHGADMMIIGDVPIGCGLSSSASLEMAALALFEALGNFRMEGAEAPQLGRRVENEFLGLSSGIMDQFISRRGKAGHALFLDCRSYEYELVPVAFPQARFVIANTGVSRGLTSSKYNQRVAECQEALLTIRMELGKVAYQLRDCDLGDLYACEDVLSKTPFIRARHVITENIRTISACTAMRDGDAAKLGMLMNESHQSLRSDYEVTCPELDVMTGIARRLPGCFGARMTGAGFGGCTINLVADEDIGVFCERLLSEYEKQTGIKGEIIVSSPADGASFAAI